MNTVTFSTISFGRIKASINGRDVAHITQLRVGHLGAEVPHILDYEVVSYTALIIDSGVARTFACAAPGWALEDAREWVRSRLSLGTTNA